jgi:hypothetical protein
MKAHVEHVTKERSTTINQLLRFKIKLLNSLKGEVRWHVHYLHLSIAGIDTHIKVEMFAYFSDLAILSFRACELQPTVRSLFLFVTLATTHPNRLFLGLYNIKLYQSMLKKKLLLYVFMVGIYNNIPSYLIKSNIHCFVSDTINRYAFFHQSDFPWGHHTMDSNSVP